MDNASSVDDSQTDWQRLDTMQDEGIDLSDNPEVTHEMLAKGVVRHDARRSMDRDYVRELARRVAEIAASEENRRIIQRWRDVNALRPVDRAPVWCRPVGAWEELLPRETWRCQDPWLRAVEYGLRQICVQRVDRPGSGDRARGGPPRDYVAAKGQ